jgi:hypothetical protein
MNVFKHVRPFIPRIGQRPVPPPPAMPVVDPNRPLNRNELKAIESAQMRAEIAERRAEIKRQVEEKNANYVSVSALARKSWEETQTRNPCWANFLKGKGWPLLAWLPLSSPLFAMETVK